MLIPASKVYARVRLARRVLTGEAGALERAASELEG